MNKRIVLLNIVIPLVIMVFTMIYIIKNIALWLYQRDPIPEVLDVICTFEGNHNREIYALELYKKFKPIWIVSTHEKEWFASWAEKCGVDKTKLILHSGCQSTWEEIQFFNEKLYEIQQQKIINEKAIIGLVSCHYHMRRIMLVNSIRKYRSHLKIISLPVPIERSGISLSNAKKWWQYKKYRETVTGELVKMFGDVISTIPTVGLWIRNTFERNS